MQIKNFTHLIHEIEGHFHHYVCDPNASLSEVEFVLKALLNYVQQRIESESKKIEEKKEAQNAG